MPRPSPPSSLGFGPPWTSGSGVALVNRLTTVSHPDAVSRVRALAITAKGRGVRSPFPSKRAILSLHLALTGSMGSIPYEIPICESVPRLALRVVYRGVSVHPQPWRLLAEAVVLVSLSPAIRATLS